VADDCNLGLGANADADAAPSALSEDVTHVYADFELPSVKEGDISVTLHEGVLTVETKRERQPDRRFHHDQRHFGPTRNVLRLPDNLDFESVQAKLANGNLTVSFAKSMESMVRTIPVHAAQ
jgi:HSP20 family protein